MPVSRNPEDDSDASSVMSTSSCFAGSQATSATSHDVEMRSVSPAPSVYSVTSSIRAASYRHEYGRGINNYSDVYRLPADDEELEEEADAEVDQVLFALTDGKLGQAGSVSTEVPVSGHPLLTMFDLSPGLLRSHSSYFALFRRSLHTCRSPLFQGATEQVADPAEDERILERYRQELASVLS